jgi:elongation factor 3
MAPALDVKKPAEGSSAKENAKSIKVLEEMLKKLTVSQSEDEIRESALSLATFVNGDIEEGDVPTK